MYTHRDWEAILTIGESDNEEGNAIGFSENVVFDIQHCRNGARGEQAAHLRLDCKYCVGHEVPLGKGEGLVLMFS
jgi:hypothetical protein